MRLSLPAAGVVVGVGLALAGIWTATAASGGIAEWARHWPSTVAAIVTAVLVAALAARWLGSPLGALAGLAHLTGLHVFQGTEGRVDELWLCAAVTAAMGAFAVANVPGRLPLVDRPWPRWAFWAATGMAFVFAGATGPALILTGCLLFVALCGDSRGGRFFADPAGVALFGLMIALRLGLPECRQRVWSQLSGCFFGGPGYWTWMPEVFGSLALGALPWTPLAVLAVVFGIRRGHYATPVWRFFGCWLLGPLALTAVGAFGDRPSLVALLPPMTVIGTAGLWGVLIRCRRGWR